MPPERTSGHPAFPFGAWPSPISTSDVVRSGVRPAYPTVLGEEFWWEEDRPAEGGRRTIVQRAPDGTRRELLPAPWDARSRVHEYGGRSHAVAPGVGVVFAHRIDQRLYVLPAGGGEPTPITPAPEITAGVRYAELTVHDGEVWCVQESHAEDGKIARAIVSVPLDGAVEPHRRVTGSDFYASPAISPGGGHLAYICWDHPRMPWTGTELRVTSLTDGASRLVAGGPAESVLAPRWKDEHTLYLISDRSGWWNLQRASIHGGHPEPLCPAEEEFSWAMGELAEVGGAPYAVLGDGRIAVLHGRGDLRLAIFDPRTGVLTDPGLPYDGWFPSLSADGAVLCGVAYGARIPRTVVRVDTSTGQAEGLRHDAGALPDAAYLPVPRQVEIHSRFGRRVHAYVYPPTNPAVPECEARPPYVVFVHGGPTSHSISALDLGKAYFTSRGIGVIDVNYGGSTDTAAPTATGWRVSGASLMSRTPSPPPSGCSPTAWPTPNASRSAGAARAGGPPWPPAARPGCSAGASRWPGSAPTPSAPTTSSRATSSGWWGRRTPCCTPRESRWPSAVRSTAPCC